MSNTRHAKPGSEINDERYASDPLLCKGVKAGDVVRRCETLETPDQVEMAFFLQYVSNLPGSLDKLAADLLAEFPERIGTASMRKLKLNPKDLMGSNLTVALEECDSEFALEIYRRSRSEGDFYFNDLIDIFRKKFLAVAPALIRQFCLDPAFQIDQLKLDSFHDLPGALLAYMDRWERRILAELVVTEVGAKVLEALYYSEDQKCLALVEGFARTGKTFVSRAWCAARPGRRRYLSLSEASTEKDFFREISRALGATASYARKGNELRERVNDILQPCFLTLVIDEAHFLWPTRNIRNASPRRIEWVRASLANYGVPVVMIATHQFTKAQQQIEKHTNWSSEQLIGRIAFCAKLPDHLGKDDIAAVARFHLPEAEDRTINFLVDYVIASKKHLASIDHGIRAARHEARKAGRAIVTHKDVLLGFHNTVLPSDGNLIAASQSPDLSLGGRKKGQIKVDSTPLQRPLKQLSAPVPEPDSGTALLAKSDRQNARSNAGLSPAEI